MKIYDYIFYRLTKFNLKSEGTLGFASYKSICLMSGLLFFNIYLILLLIKITRIFEFPEVFSFIHLVLFGLFNLLILYFRYLTKNNMNKLINRYKDESKSQKNINLLKAIVFIILSILAPFVLVTISDTSL